MGQISPLDQLISTSAFSDCSVTVIYFRVPPLRRPVGRSASMCFLGGATPASFTVVLCIFFAVFQRGSLTGRHEPRRLPTTGDGRGLAWERRLHFIPSDRSQSSLFEPEWHLAVMLPLQIIRPLLPDVHTRVTASETDFLCPSVCFYWYMTTINNIISHCNTAD